MLLLTVGAASAGEPAIVAHRGASHDAPENTLSAVRLGFEQGADFVEVDLRLSADGQIVLIHDADTQRTGGVKKPVAEQTLSELKNLDVGSFKAARFAGERIPTLAESLAVVPRGKGMFLELKTGPEIVPELVKVLDASSLSPEQVVVIAFNFETIIEAKRRLPRFQALWLASIKLPVGDDPQIPRSASADELLQRARGKVDGLDLKATASVTREVVERARRANLPVYVWTVNDADAARKLRDLGVSGITTDRPAWLRRALEMAD